MGTKMNDLDLRLEVVSRSCQLLRHICHWISRIPRKPLDIETWFQGPTIGNGQRASNGHVTNDVTWPCRRQAGDRWQVYGGAKPWRHRKTSIASLNWA